MENILIVAALAVVLGVPVAHAQSSATLIGLHSNHLRHLGDSNGERLWLLGYDVPHCRRFGLGMIQDIGPYFQPHFVLETGPELSGDRQYGAVATMHSLQAPGSIGPDRFSWWFLPWC